MPLLPRVSGKLTGKNGFLSFLISFVPSLIPKLWLRTPTLGQLSHAAPYCHHEFRSCSTLSPTKKTSDYRRYSVSPVFPASGALAPRDGLLLLGFLKAPSHLSPFCPMSTSNTTWEYKPQSHIFIFARINTWVGDTSDEMCAWVCERGLSTRTVKAPLPNGALSHTHAHTYPFQCSQQLSGPGPDLMELVKEVGAPEAFAFSCLSAGLRWLLLGNH